MHVHHRLDMPTLHGFQIQSPSSISTAVFLNPTSQLEYHNDLPRGLLVLLLSFILPATNSFQNASITSGGPLMAVVAFLALNAKLLIKSHKVPVP